MFIYPKKLLPQTQWKLDVPKKFMVKNKFRIFSGFF